MYFILSYIFLSANKMSRNKVWSHLTAHTQRLSLFLFPSLSYYSIEKWASVLLKWKILLTFQTFRGFLLQSFPFQEFLEWLAGKFSASAWWGRRVINLHAIKFFCVVSSLWTNSNRTLPKLLKYWGSTAQFSEPKHFCCHSMSSRVDWAKK